VEAYTSALGILRLAKTGFLSEANMTEMVKQKTRFMMPLGSELALSQGLIDKHRETIEDMDNIIEADDAYTAAIYATTVVSKLAGKRIWYHLYFDTLAFKESLLRLFEKIAVCETELKSGNLKPSHTELYEKYLIVKETPRRGRSVKRNQEEIATRRAMRVTGSSPPMLKRMRTVPLGPTGGATASSASSKTSKTSSTSCGFGCIVTLLSPAASSSSSSHLSYSSR
jgi:hypothetical protein